MIRVTMEKAEGIKTGRSFLLLNYTGENYDFCRKT